MEGNSKEDLPPPPPLPPGAVRGQVSVYGGGEGSSHGASTSRSGPSGGRSSTALVAGTSQAGTSRSGPSGGRSSTALVAGTSQAGTSRSGPSGGRSSTALVAGTSQAGTSRSGPSGGRSSTALVAGTSQAGTSRSGPSGGRSSTALVAGTSQAGTSCSGPSGGTSSTALVAGTSGGMSSALVARADVNPLKKAMRPGFGRVGEPTQLVTNHFRAKVVKWDDIYHYNVSIDPPLTSKKVCRDILNKLQQTFGQVEFGGKLWAYDGETALFTSGSLPFNSMDFPVFLDDFKGSSFRPGDRGGRHGHSPPMGSPPPGSPGQEIVPKRRKTIARGRDFTVRIEFAAKIRMRAIDEMMRGATGRCNQELEIRASEALRVLDILLRESASQRGYLLVRDNFFHPSLGMPCDLGGGVEGWHGYHSSVRPTGLGLTLNLDITMTTIVKPIMVEEFLKEMFKVNNLYELRERQKEFRKAKSVLKGIRIETTHLPVSQSHKIAGFSDKNIQLLKFTKKIKDGQGNAREVELSVQQYYWDTYNYKLKYPNFPALDVGNKKKPTYMPIELCRIVAGQRYTKSLSSQQRTKQIAACKQGPRERQNRCERAMQVSQYNSDRLLAEFGLQFDQNLAKVTGRMLPAPKLRFGNGKTEAPYQGRWNFSDKKMHQGITIPSWAVAVFDERCRDGAEIARQLKNCCCRQGMNMPEVTAVVKETQDERYLPPEERVKVMLEVHMKKFYPEFILAILPTDASNSDLYVAFKRHWEIKYKKISQCMIRPRSLNAQYFGNLALKINLKMGGLNSPLSMDAYIFLTRNRESTIIFGMDVSHGSTGEDAPSIAAVVATKNWPEVSHYASRVREQPSRMEMIEGLHVEGQNSGMIRDLLLEHYRSCDKELIRRPAQIIVYRDGISESQFAECIEKEAIAIKRACRDLEEGYENFVKLVFIVSQKRHNTRFFPQGQAIKSGNVIPGTVVDKDVCHPHNYDFFLVSQAGFIGTSRPTHYHVLVNESKLSPDDIQGLTNNLCYTFGRCSTSISMAAPAAYAHVLAARYRKLVDPWRGSDTSSLRSGGSGGPSVVKPPGDAYFEMKMKEEYSMFFC
ncbi:hypothetical protein M758_10G049800 [Ceratodon purpureus]|nr:hypothetical protein M758_10G049800 [Ceratodon purpureus]